MFVAVRLAALAAAIFVAGPALAITTGFDAPLTLASGQTAGAWYVDRYAPAGFAAPTLFAGDNRLKQSIAATDGVSGRPPQFSATFYNTQGRKFDVEPGTTSASIDLYVASDWAGTGRRMAGLWGTGFDADGNVSFYSTLEFTSLGGTPLFRAWNGNGYTDIGLPTGFAYDGFTRIGYALSGGDVVYTVGDLSISVDANGTTAFGNIMLQGHNTADGVSYDIYWDNLATSAAGAVPEPAAWGLMLVGFGLVGGVLRRRGAVAAIG